MQRENNKNNKNLNNTYTEHSLLQLEIMKCKLYPKKDCDPLSAGKREQQRRPKLTSTGCNYLDMNQMSKYS